MKILTSLFGLILFIAGIYLTYWVFQDFDSFETLILGLYLGGSFILMTFGFYLFLLPLSFKSKNYQDFNTEKSIEKEPNHPISPEPEVISEVDAIKIIRDETSKEDFNQITPEIKQANDNLEPILPHELTDELTLRNEETKQSQLDLDSIITNSHTEELKFKKDEVYDIIEMRVIGIDAWSSQNILKRIDDSSKLDLNQKLKSGINMTQVLYNKKLIGYVSRLDMNKIQDRLNELVSITPSNMIKEGHKIVHFSINLKFKQKDN